MKDELKVFKHLKCFLLVVYRNKIEILFMCEVFLYFFTINSS